MGDFQSVQGYHRILSDEAFLLYDGYYMCLSDDANIQNQYLDMKYPFYEWLRLMKLSKSNGFLLKENNSFHWKHQQHSSSSLAATSSHQQTF